MAYPQHLSFIIRHAITGKILGKPIADLTKAIDRATTLSTTLPHTLEIVSGAVVVGYVYRGDWEPSDAAPEASAD